MIDKILKDKRRIILLKKIKEKGREIPIVIEADVIVAGGGTAGVVAAIASARRGLKVVIVERYGFFGGMCTAGYVTLLPIWNLTPWREENESLIGGIAKEIEERLDLDGGAIRSSLAKRYQNNKPVLPYWPAWTQFDFETMKLIMQEMIQEEKIEIFLHTFIVDAIIDSEMVKGIIIENKSGRQALLGKIIIDCTGDGDVFYRAGAEYDLSSTENITPVTLPFYVGGVNNKEAVEYLQKDPTLQDAIKKSKSNVIENKNVLQGSVKIKLSYVDLPLEYSTEKKYAQIERKGTWYIWGAHSSNKNVVINKDLTKAELETRIKVKELFSILKKNVPGFQDSYICSTATQIGIRESRRLVGEYILTKDDILNGQHFDDVVLRSRTGEWELTEKTSPPPFDIPYRCILPRNIDNLLVAGRCISISHSAARLFSPRDISTCMGLGEVAGISAATACKENVKPRDIDISKLQKEIKKNKIY